MSDEYGTRLDQLSPTKRQLLERLRQRAAVASDLAPPARRPAGRVRVPLSVIQEQLWFLDQVAPHQPTYNVAVASELVGTLDLDALRAALDGLVARHESLRTVFAADDEGVPYQSALPAAPASLVIDDLTGLPPAKGTAAALRTVIDHEVHGLFDLSRGPLFRARLIRLGADRHVLSLAAHHIAVDGWSLGLIATELGELYAAHREGRAPRLTPPPLQYPDFALWQREAYLPSATLKGHLTYWEQRLAGLPVFDLPADRPRPAVVSFRGTYHRHGFAPDTRDRLKELTRRTGASPLMVLLAAYKAVLSRYTGADDIVIGTAVPARTRPELESMVGCFTNFVVLRTDVGGDPTFADLTRRVGDTVLGAWEHQDAPFEKVVERLRHTRDTGRNPLFTVSMQMLDQSTGGGVLTLPGLAATALDLRLERSRFDLAASVTDDGRDLFVLTEYSTDLFDEPRVARLMRHVERVLRAAADDPELRLSGLPLLADHERDRVLSLAQGPEREFRRMGLHVLAAAAAARQPDAIAVVADGAETTYGELDRLAGALAERLLSLGTARGSVVGIAMERGLDALVAILATLKAGAAYLPLDPAFPARRLAQILDDARCSLVLTHSDHLDGLHLASIRATGAVDSPGWTALCLDKERPQDMLAMATLAPGPVPGARGGSDGDDLAYVLYTSGSTGTPKGVPVEHGMVCAYLDWMVGAQGFGPGSRVLHASTLTFDASVAEIFNTLASGATLVVSSPDDVVTPGALAELIRRERITHLFATPAVLKLVEPGDYPHLSTVIVGGEVCTADLVTAWRAPGRRFSNVYGPTETTIACIGFDCADWDGPADPPIGRPMANRTAHLVDRWFNPVPVGVPGEILLGGEGVGRGYLHSPELTASRFIEDPFRPGRRAYRSGDMGCWTEDGQIRFLGRTDAQIKLRGLRIELGDIEAALLRHPGVAQAAAVMRTEPEGEARIVAYAVRATSDGAPTEDLRQHLARELPTYMVPSAIVFLDGIPLTPAGKVDRRRLPEPVADRAPSTRPFVAPRTAAEAEVAAVFADVLGIERAGVEDDFFALGGHSLQAARVLAQLLARTGARLPMASFYQASTVGAVAARLTADPSFRDGTETAAAGHRCLVPLGPAGRQPGLFVVHAVSGSPYWYSGMVRQMGSGRTVHGFEAPGLEGETEPIEGLVELAARYVEELREAQPAGPYLLAGWSMGGFVAFEMSRQLAESGADVALTALIDADAPGPFDAPPELEIMSAFATDLASVAGRPVPELDPALAGLGPADRLARLVSWLVSAELIPGDIRRESIYHRYAVFRSNVRNLYRYRPTVHPGRLAFLQAGESRDNSAAWARYAAGGVDRVEVPGDHYSMWSAPNLPALVAALEARIARALGD